jgi:hypothetical protein
MEIKSIFPRFFSNPIPSFPGFEFPLAFHSISARGEGFKMEQGPGTGNSFCVEGAAILGVVVLRDSSLKFFSLANVCRAKGIDQDVNEKFVAFHGKKKEPTIRRGELTADRSIRRGGSYPGIIGSILFRPMG